jgi:hypothetical protein
MADYTSEGAKLIFALRDLYSSKPGIKASVRNELVARIIKLIINESQMEQSQGFGDPVGEGISYNIRSPIIIPQEGVSLLALTVPSVILHYGAKCVGAFCHALSQIKDEEASSNLNPITERINTILAENTANEERFEKFNNIKLWFDNKERRDDYGDVVKLINADHVATMLINNMPFTRIISESNKKKYKNNLIKSIQKLNFLFFISNFYYDALYYIFPERFEYNDNYINKLFKIIQNCIPVTESSAEYGFQSAKTLADNTGVSSSDLPVATGVSSSDLPVATGVSSSGLPVTTGVENSGGKNTRRRKSHKKQNQKRI